MQPFTYCNPTKIIFGEGTVPQLGTEVSAFGKRALLVYGQSSIKRSGLSETVLSSLQEADLAVLEWPGVKPNPLLGHARGGVELAKREKIDVVVAVGGGSVIDEAKAIAAGAVTDRDIWDFYARAVPVEAALPILTVLTLPAAGSEMNGGTVLTNEATQEKFGFMAPPLHPRASILDPTLTYTVPPSYTAYSAVDSMTHLLEGYFTHGDFWAPIQERYVEGLLKTIMECTERILAKPDDYPARSTMMWAATLAWNGLANAGLGAIELPNHMLEHPLSGIYDLPHGAGLSVVLPAWLTFAARKEPARVAQMARNVFGVAASDEAFTAEQGIAALRGWFDKVGSPTSFAKAELPVEEIDKIADHAVRLAATWGITRYTREDIVAIYRLAAQDQPAPATSSL